MKRLTSRDNPCFKHLRALNEDARYRRQEGLSLIDGDHLVRAAFEADWPVRRLILREDVVDSLLVKSLLDLSRQAPDELIVLSVSLFKALSPVITPTGILAEISCAPRMPFEVSGGDVLALAGVQDAGNLGTLLRSAVAAGIREVWLDAKTAQAWSPKALRAGMGAHFNLRIEQGCELAQRLSEDSRPCRVTCLADDSISLFELDLRAPGIWVFGAEGQGVPAEIIALASEKIAIPMPGRIESLNVSAAAAVCLFEAVRQRQISVR